MDIASRYPIDGGWSIEPVGLRYHGGMVSHPVAPRLVFAALALSVGCLPLDAELPSVADLTVVDQGTDGAPDQRVDAAIIEPDRAPPMLDAAIDAVLDDAAGLDAQPMDAAPIDGGSIDVGPMEDGGVEVDAGPSLCPPDDVRPGAPSTLLGPRDGAEVGVDPISMAFIGDDLFVLDGHNRRIVRAPLDGSGIWPVVGEVPGEPFDALRTPGERVVRPLLDMAAGVDVLFAVDGQAVYRIDPTDGTVAPVMVDAGDRPTPLTLPDAAPAVIAVELRDGNVPRLLLAGPGAQPMLVYAATCTDDTCATTRAPAQFSGFRRGDGRHCGGGATGARLIYDTVRTLASSPTRLAVGTRAQQRRGSGRSCLPMREYLAVRLDGEDELRLSGVPCRADGCAGNEPAQPFVDIAWRGEVAYAIESNRLLRIDPVGNPRIVAVANPTGASEVAADGSCASLTGFDRLRSVAVHPDGAIAVGSAGRVEILEPGAACGDDLIRRRLIGRPDDDPVDPVAGRPGTALALGDPRGLTVADDIVYVADGARTAIHRVSLIDGLLQPPIELGAGSAPAGLDAAEGTIWGVATAVDRADISGPLPWPRLFAIDADGARTVPWGVGPSCRDDRPGLFAPLDLAVDGADLIIADLFRIRRLTVADDAPDAFADVVAAPPPVADACAIYAGCPDDVACRSGPVALPQPWVEGEAIETVAVAGGAVWATVTGRGALIRCADAACEAMPVADAVDLTSLHAVDDGLRVGWTDGEGTHRLGAFDPTDRAVEPLAGCTAPDCAPDERRADSRLGPIGAIGTDPRTGAIVLADGPRIRRLSAGGFDTLIAARDPRGIGPLTGGWLPEPGALAADGDGGWVVAGGPGRLFRVDGPGGYSASLAGAPDGHHAADDPCDGGIERPAHGLSFGGSLVPLTDPAGAQVIVDPGAGRIWRLSDGALSCVWRAEGEARPASGAIDPQTGAIYIAIGTTIHRFEVDGRALRQGPEVATLGLDKGPLSMAIDAGVLYIGTRIGTLFTVDLASGGAPQVVGVVEAGGYGTITGVAAAADRVWFSTGDRVWQLDPTADQIAGLWPRQAPDTHHCIGGLAAAGVCGAVTVAFTDRCDGALVELPLGPRGD